MLARAPLLQARQTDSETTFKRIQGPRICIFIAIRRPSSGHFYHWSLAIHDEVEDSWYVFEAVRFQPRAPFQVHKLTTDPRSTAYRMVPVSTLPHSKLEGVRDAIDVAIISDTNTNYDNQDYIMSIFDSLHQRGYITEDEDDKAWRVLMPYFGWQKHGLAKLVVERKRYLRKHRIFLSNDRVYDSDMEEP